MPTITDPDLFLQSAQARSGTPTGNIYINYSTKTIQAITSDSLANINFGSDDGSDKPVGVQPNPLDATDGFDMNAFYSWLTEETKTDAALRRELPFLVNIDARSGQYQWLQGWKFDADVDRFLARSGGWDERTGTTTVNRIYYNPVGIGVADAALDLAYYALTSDVSVDGTDLNFGGLPNEPVRVDQSDQSYFEIQIRSWGRSYAFSDLVLINSSGTGAFSENHGLNVSTDVNITDTENNVGTLALYTGITLNYLPGTGFGIWFNGLSYAANAVVQSLVDGRWYYTSAGGTASGDASDLLGGSDTGVTWIRYTGERQIGDSYYPFNRIFANGGTAATKEVYYHRERWLRRRGTNINNNSANTGNIIGRRADELLSFTRGQDLGLPFGTAVGVFIDDLSLANINEVAFRDATGTLRKFPTQTPVTATFNDVARSDPDLKVDFYFADAGGNTYPGGNAIIIDDVNGNDVVYTAFTGTIDRNGYQDSTVYAANTVVQDVLTVEGIWYITTAGGTSDGATLAEDAGVTWAVYQSPATFTFTFDYDNNTQGGRTAAEDFALIARATGRTKAIEGAFNGSVTATSGNVGIVMSAQRNFSNP